MLSAFTAKLNDAANALDQNRLPSVSACLPALRK